MKLPPAPLRFLLLVVGCWAGVRAFTLLPGAPDDAEPAVEAATVPPVQATGPTAEPVILPATFASGDAAFMARPEYPGPPRHPTIAWLSFPATHSPTFLPVPPTAAPLAGPMPAPQPGSPRQHAPIPASPPTFTLSPRAPTASRWAGSAWAFVRDDGNGGTLAPGGTLGGSQAGARLTYRLNNDSQRPISLSARLYTLLQNPRGAEAALGIDWRPIARLPINLLAERREAIGRDGRSDFALMLHGGAEARLANGRIRVEGYGQAGIVGVEARDLFADGAITATNRIGPLDVGGGAWGGSQPGAARLDVGPHASFRLPVGRATIRASAEWRFRVAGDAAPDSGPTLTISAGF